MKKDTGGFLPLTLKCQRWVIYAPLPLLCLRKGRTTASLSSAWIYAIDGRTHGAIGNPKQELC